MNKDLKPLNKKSEFELDTADNIKTLLQKKLKKAAQDKHIPDAVRPQKIKRKINLNFKILSICIAALLLITIGLLCFQNQNFSFSFLSGSPNNSSKNYLRVGPISTTLSNNNIIRFSMDISLENESAKEKLTEKAVFVKNQIISIITKPSTAELIKTHQYDLIKAQIQNNLEKTTGETVSEIYFSELRIF